MTFTCAYCKKQIQTVGSVHHGEFLHNECVEAYKLLINEGVEDIEEEEILSEE